MEDIKYLLFYFFIISIFLLFQNLFPWFQQISNMVSALCNHVLKIKKARRVKNMTNKILTIFVAVFVIGIVMMIGVYAYKGNPTLNGPNYTEAVHEQLESAIDNNDYDSWIKIRQENNLPMNGRMFKAIDKDNFNLYVEMHNANIAGDIDRAESIKAELGLGHGMMNSKARSGMHGSGIQNSGMQDNEMHGSGPQRANMDGGRSEQGSCLDFIDLDNNGVCDNYVVNRPLD
jgi:hypothetical protein